MKKLFPVFVFFSFLAVVGQKTTVKATRGDGIFSILRKQGLDPIKYYSEFVKLNKDNLKNGSELYLGRLYLIPDAPDSFKKMAVQLQAHSDSEKAIFNEKELAVVSPKSKRLKDAVIYLLSGDNTSKSSESMRAVEQEIMQRLVSQLMVHGAKVYLLENDSILSVPTVSDEELPANLERPIGNHEQMQYYVDAINQRYLKNQGKYQRVLVMNLNKSLTNSNNLEVSIFHHSNSPEGEHFANSLQAIFSKSGRVKQENRVIFKNDRNLFLVKNVVPPITMITLHDAQPKNKQKRISSVKNKKELTDIITSGVLKDYAELSLEEN